ncbi:11218_t:CDS:10 [Funneliformis geosporum]|uniref:Ubiquilin n=1 Tax=Funneliformis geosporum TaxID=1117311 RepID=A0A9W4SRL9_9GLOM|nr:11218_t:CDS:10 [Funneliformis geosporum]CAI2178729.1 14192_t:CDS:10 [Funneliformis geosporum]
MTTAMNSHTTSMFAPEMKGLHVIEFITNEQPYPAEKLIEKLQEFQASFQEEYEDFSVGSSKMHSSSHQFSVPFFGQQHDSRLFDGIESTAEDDLEAGDDNEVEALIKKNAVIKTAIEKIRKATEEQEKQLRDKEEELQELYETFAELEEELQVITHEQPHIMTKFERIRDKANTFNYLNIILFIMEDSNEQLINVKFRPSTGDGFDYRFDPGQLTVQQLKEKLALRTTIPANSMRLVYSGRVLKDEDMVDLYGVKEGHTIHVVRGADNRAAEQAANVPPSSTGQRSTNSATTNPFANFDQDLMRSMMNSPMIRHLLSNPEIVRSMVMQNPTMRQMIERNPEIGHIINDPSFIRQTMDMARNPELMREMMRNNDRALANLETIPGGFNHLRRMYHTLQEPLESAGRNNDQSSEAANRRLAEMLNVESPPEGRINVTPLPNPWAPRNNNNSSTSGNITSMFGGIPSFGIMGFQMPFPSPSSASRIANSTQGSTTPSTTQNSQTNETPNATSLTNAPGTTQNFSNINIPQNLSMSTDPEYSRRIQQVMQRFMTSSQFASRQQMPQSYYPTSLFGSPNPFFTNMSQSLGASQTTTSEPPETRFRAQLQTLEEMGFMDQAENIRALLAAGGDVNSAIEMLLRNLNSA